MTLDKQPVRTTPEEREAIQQQLHPSLRGELLLQEDIPHLTDAQFDALLPNFVPIWRGVLRELLEEKLAAQQQSESESA